MITADGKDSCARRIDCRRSTAVAQSMVARRHATSLRRGRGGACLRCHSRALRGGASRRLLARPTAAIRARCVRTMRTVSFERRRVWRVQYGRGFTEGLPSIRAWEWRGGLCLGNLAKAADRRAHGGGGGGVKCVRAARNLRRREKGTGKY